ncbi:RNA-directed DNA polymerase, eukaryota, reverse transcriptase zinc-binding domain protein, partial [Tanacetum coccineum]
MKPSNEESKHWSSEMWNYFNEKWEGIGKGDEDTYSNNKFEENVYEEYSGDLNVTLKLDEHSEGMSCSTVDMVEFQECIEKIELEDIKKTGCHFTWTKSLRNPETAIMKKLDRIIGNGEFIDKFPQAQACFHPFIVSDHSLAVLI